MIVFSLANNRKWMVSLYSTKETVDCSIITKKYGGGGHRSAAGMCFTNEQMLGLIGA
jgi:nanoRNase/pAp phosphatase (c-di-AMP/oligoRNAs hydrolase)